VDKNFTLKVFEENGYIQWCREGGTPFPQTISGQRGTVSVPPSKLAKKCKVYLKFILGKITEIVATRCHILKIKCTIFDFG